MPRILDHHRKSLCMDVWDTAEQSLNSRAKAQIYEQLQERFPEAENVYLVGDMTGHYWNELSDVDLLVQVRPENIPKYKEEAQFATGYELKQTDHRLNFFIVSTETDASTVAKHFGPLFNIGSGVWLGDRSGTTNELTRPEALLRYINWRLFKAKFLTVPEPYSWKVATTAFQVLTEDERQQVLVALRARIPKLEKSINKRLRREEASNWKLLDGLEVALEEGIEEVPTDYAGLPQELLFAALNVFRYKDLIDLLEYTDEESQMPNGVVARTSPQRREGDGDQDNFWHRVNNLLVRIVVSRGGFSNAEDTIYEIFKFVLENNRFTATTPIRRRRIAMRLYNTFYRGRE